MAGQGAGFLAFNPDGRTLATNGTPLDRIRLWDVTHRTRPAQVAVFATAGATGGVHTMVFSPDGRALATLGSGGRKLWDLTDRARPTHLCTLAGEQVSVGTIAFHPAGHRLATSLTGGGVKIWNLIDPARPVPLSTFTAKADVTLSQMAFSPDGRTLATAFVLETIPTRRWDVTDPVHPAARATIAGTCRSIAFSPDNHTPAAGTIRHSIELLRR